MALIDEKGFSSITFSKTLSSFEVVALFLPPDGGNDRYCSSLSSISTQRLKVSFEIPLKLFFENIYLLIIWSYLLFFEFLKGSNLAHTQLLFLVWWIFEI